MLLVATIPVCFIATEFANRTLIADATTSRTTLPSEHKASLHTKTDALLELGSPQLTANGSRLAVASIRADEMPVYPSDTTTKLRGLHPNTSRFVPFYSQFTDITDPAWQKLGCGIAAIAMLIDYHTEITPSLDALLARGRAAGAFLPNAGWTHAGLIDLTRPYGLTGESVGLHHLSAETALEDLRLALRSGPVLASVHYTFEPTNPIPHLVVITGIDGDTVHYNDPAEATGGGTLTVEKFQLAWKQRYIAILPTA